MRDLLKPVTQWLTTDDDIYLATVVSTWGSSPRPVGAKMAFRQDLSMVGSVSGGCIEGAVIETGLTLDNQQGRMLHYGVSDELALNVGLSCGGEIDVYVETLDRQWWQCLTDALINDLQLTAITVIDGESTGEKVLLDESGQVRYHNLDRDPQHLLSLVSDYSTTRVITTPDTTLFVDIIRQQPHLIMIGGSHIAIPLHSFAKTLDFRVTLIDPRTAFASQERFPEVDTILHRYPIRALPQIGLDTQTYLAILTHDPKIDDDAIVMALKTDVPYIGVLSSRKTHAARKQRLIARGMNPAQLDRLRTPIGIDIASKTPAEIALSIMSEIVQVKNTTAS